MTAPEPSQRGVIRLLIRCDHPKRHIVTKTLLDTAARAFSRAICIQENAEHHLRVIGGAAPSTRARPPITWGNSPDRPDPTEEVRHAIPNRPLPHPYRTRRRHLGTHRPRHHSTPRGRPHQQSRRRQTTRPSPESTTLSGCFTRSDPGTPCMGPKPGQGHWEHQKGAECPRCVPVEEEVSAYLSERMYFERQPDSRWRDSPGTRSTRRLVEDASLHGFASNEERAAGSHSVSSCRTEVR